MPVPQYMRDLAAILLYCLRCLGLALLALIGFPCLFISWVVQKTTFELWRHYGPASRTKDRSPLKRRHDLFFAKRRRNLSMVEHADAARHSWPSNESTINESTQMARGFYDLPFELREQIWLYSLQIPGPILVSDRPHVRKITWSARDIAGGRDLPQYDLLATLRLNRRCYAEGINLLYAINSFHFNSANVLTSFARVVLPHRLALIRQVKLTVRYQCLAYFLTSYSTSFRRNDWKRACKCLQQFTGLKTLRIRIEVGSFDSGFAGWAAFTSPIRDGWLKDIMGPLEPSSATDDFVVEYPWPKRICSEWPTGKFTMQPGGDVV
ncbi:hypothetical protein Q7P37_005330 [Cladosporium fusiforme]